MSMNTEMVLKGIGGSEDNLYSNNLMHIKAVFNIYCYSLHVAISCAVSQMDDVIGTKSQDLSIIQRTHCLWLQNQLIMCLTNKEAHQWMIHGEEGTY